MAKRKKSMKKVSAPAMRNKSCCCTYMGRGYGMVKLSAMAFILFLITVWPWAMDLVHSIHWGWFLGATIVFGAIAMGKMCRKRR
jgi:hypothetical protein